METRIMLKLNGTARQLDVAPWTTLLDALRESLDLTGTKRRKGATTDSAGPAPCARACSISGAGSTAPRSPRPSSTT
jgi:aerobic-type carbon monoxide dehydrogenase small subunit (CoxS/CutS family)